MSYQPIYSPEEKAQIDALIEEINKLEATPPPSDACRADHKRWRASIIEKLRELNDLLDKRSSLHLLQSPN